MKRVLVLAYLFPPIANAGTQRPLKFAKYLSQYGWHPVVITTSQFAGHTIDPALLEDLPDSVRVRRVPMLNDVIADTVAALGGHTRAARALADGLRRRLQAHARTPDRYALWRLMATRAALQLFRQQPFDAIYATGYPWTTLLVGRDVSIRTGRPLLTDFCDPWVAEDLFRDGGPASETELALERSVVTQSTSVITVSDTLTRRMRAAYPELPDAKFATIHNGFDAGDLPGPSAPARGRFRIVFAGVWNRGYNPSALYDVIEWLKRSQPRLLEGVEVIAAGFEPGEARRRNLSDSITEVGVLPHRQALALLQSADVLFMTNADGARQQLAIPGKLYEYLATGRPVMAVTHPDGAAGRLLKRTGGGIVIPADDPGELFDAIVTLCRTRRLDAPTLNPDELASFDRVALTRRLAQLLDDAVRRHAISHTHRPNHDATAADLSMATRHPRSA